MAKHSDKGRRGKTDLDLGESSVYGNGQTELDSDDVARETACSSGGDHRRR